MRLCENICSPELLGDSVLCQRNASCEGNNSQQIHSVSSSLSSLQRKPGSAFLALGDHWPEQGNLQFFIESPNLAHPKGVFWGLIKKRGVFPSLCFKWSQHTWAGGSPHNTGLSHENPCPGMLQMPRDVWVWFSRGKARLMLWSELPSLRVCASVSFLTCCLQRPSHTYTAKHQRHGWDH